VKGNQKKGKRGNCFRKRVAKERKKKGVRRAKQKTRPAMFQGSEQETRETIDRIAKKNKPGFARRVVVLHRLEIPRWQVGGGRPTKKKWKRPCSER